MYQDFRVIALVFTLSAVVGLYDPDTPAVIGWTFLLLAGFGLGWTFVTITGGRIRARDVRSAIDKLGDVMSRNAPKGPKGEV